MSLTAPLAEADPTAANMYSSVTSADPIGD